jgi:methylglutaconyl-CoA hydratase
MMKTLRVDLSTRGVARIEMSRPEVLNAFDETMIAELDATFEQLGADPTVRVVVLAGQGKAFSAGADLQWMQRASTASQEWNLNDARQFASMLDRVASCPKPTIAQVHGVALGGGVGLACACDIAIAGQDTKFAVSEVKFGILPSVIGPYLINAVGRRQAQRLALSASRIGAYEARTIGLVQIVVPEEALAAAVGGVIDDLLCNGPNALAEVKELFAQMEVGPITAEVRELTAQTISRVRVSDEAREGFAAFLGKRLAPWVGQT